MRTALCTVAVLAATGAAPSIRAADAEAGKAKAAAVCGACHGTNGVSVSETIPNLAGQRAGYLEAQLKALKEGTRKNPVMNAIAAQLSPEDITNVAAYFSALPGAEKSAKSAFFPSLAKSHVAFPEGYKESFTRYHIINFPATKQVRHYFANKAAVQAAREGKPMPQGAMLFVEVYSAKLGVSKAPLTGADGFYVPEELLFYTAMATGAGWGKDIPEMLRNADWNYAVFTTDKQHRPGVNQAECLACHKPLDSTSYLFTLKQLSAAK